MTLLVLRFPAGRYRVTPWAGGPSEVGSPPSPCRLLRALYATWHTREPGIDERDVHETLGAIATPPCWFIPPHVMRGGGVTELERDGELVAQWPGELSARACEVLTTLASAMPYFARAESCCHATVPSRWVPDGHVRWEPLDTADTIDPGTVTAVLAPTLPLDTATLPAEPTPAAGLPIPPGTRLVAYQRQLHDPVERSAVRLDLLGEGPPATSTVAVTDLARGALLKRLHLLRGTKADTLIGGRRADETELRDQHAHTSFLPMIDAGRVTALALWTPAGLPSDEVEAAAALSRLTNRDLRLRVGPGRPGPIGAVAPTLIGPSRVWTSVTPYTPGRHPKSRDWPSAAADDVARELRHRGLPGPQTVDVLDGEWTPWLRRRPSAYSHSPQGRLSKPSTYLRLRFAKPVTGPLALGHLSHFGLGLFHPEG